MEAAHITPFMATIAWNPNLEVSIESNDGKINEPSAAPQKVMPVQWHRSLN